MTWLEHFLQDARHGFRLLTHNKSFALAAIITLAVGIGANTAIFSVVHGILLKPLPYPHPDRLTIIWTGLAEERRAPASNYQLLQMRQNSRAFEEIAGIWMTNGTVPGAGEPEQVKVARVTTNFLSLLCAEPAAGRLFRDDDAQHDDGLNVVISYGLWQRRFAGDPAVLGKILHTQNDGDDRGVTIIGVLPKDFRLILPSSSVSPDAVDIYHPVSLADSAIDGPAYLKTIGLLAPGVSVGQAQAEMDGVATRLRETSIRAIVGAGRGRLMRQLLVESLVLGLAGGAAAMLVASLAVQGLLALRPESLLRLGTIELNGTVFAYALLVSLVTVILFGFAPAIAGSRVDLHGGVKSGSGISSRDAGR